MRVVVAAHPYVGHLRIPLQLATYLAGDGHEVAVVTGPGHEGARALVPWDLPTFVVDDGMDAARFGGLVPDDVTRGEIGAVASILVGGRATVMLRELVDVLERLRPDVVLRDCTYVLAALAAERLRVPDVSLVGIPEAATHDGRRAFAAAQRRAGLPGAGDVLSAVRNLSFLPDAFYEDRLPAAVLRRLDLDAGDVATGQEAPDLAGIEVLAAFGTVSTPVKAVIKVARALGEVGVPAAVAVGALLPRFRDRPGTVPGNVRMVGFVDQARLLAGCRLFVSHAGFNSVREAIAAGCPLLVAPQLGEQHYNARRCRALGIARELDVTATSHAIAAAIAGALGDADLCAAAAAQRRVLLGAPSARDIGTVLSAVA
jgi:N-glycosyltransferase